MDELKPFSVGTDEGSWRTPGFRQNVVAKIYEFIQKSGMSTTRNSIEMENHVFLKAKTKEEYLSMVARLILHFRDINLKKTGVAGVGANPQGVQGLPNGSGGSQPNNVGGPTQNVPVTNQPGPANNTNAQGQMQVPPNPMGAPPNQVGGIQGQIPQSPMNQQGPSQQNPPITANLLQSLNQRPPLANISQMQSKMGGPGMGMMSNQSGMGGNNMAPNQMGNQVVNQMNQSQMQSQMSNPNMSGPNPMGSQMAGNNPMTNQMIQNSMSPNMPGQMVISNQMGNPLATLTGNQLNIMHMQQRKPGESLANMINANTASFQAGNTRNAPGQFLRQSPSPSAPSPATMGGPSPASIGVMAGPMPSPMSVGSGGLGVGSGGPIGGVASPALAPSPSSHHSMQQHSQQHPQQHPRSVGMVQSPSSSLNTPIGAGAAPSPVGGNADDHAYREKVRQLSKYIDPLRKMIERMVNDGENVEKMKKLLEILSHPSKRMPLETLLKCEAVLEKLDFKRNERQSLHSQSNPLLHGIKEHQIFSPLLEVVNNCLQSSVASHTLERTFGPCVEALCGPEIRHMPPPIKKQKIEEPTPDIPDILQGEIARLDSRFKVSLEGFQAGTGTGAIRLVAQLEDSRLPCVPPVSLSVPRNYPASPPTCLLPPGHYGATPFLQRIGEALSVRLSALPRTFSLSQLLDTWEMSVRQACNPNYSIPQTPGLLITSI